MRDRQFITSNLVLLEHRKVLLIYHHQLGVWLYPGGHIEPSETPDEAALRALEEETGLEGMLIGERDQRLADVGSSVSVLFQPYVVICKQVDGLEPIREQIELVYTSVPKRIARHVERLDMRAIGADGAGSLPMFHSFRTLLEMVFADQELWKAANECRARNASLPQS